MIFVRVFSMCLIAACINPISTFAVEDSNSDALARHAFKKADAVDDAYAKGESKEEIVRRLKESVAANRAAAGAAKDYMSKTGHAGVADDHQSRLTSLSRPSTPEKKTSKLKSFFSRKKASSN